MRQDIDEMGRQIGELQATKLGLARELEIVRRERNFLNESLKELKRLMTTLRGCD